MDRIDHLAQRANQATREGRDDEAVPRRPVAAFSGSAVRPAEWR